MHRAPYALKDFVLIVGQRVRLRPPHHAAKSLAPGVENPYLSCGGVENPQKQNAEVARSGTFSPAKREAGVFNL